MTAKFVAWKTGIMATYSIDQVNNQHNRLLERKAFVGLMMNQKAEGQKSNENFVSQGHCLQKYHCSYLGHAQGHRVKKGPRITDMQETKRNRQQERI